MTEVQMSVVNGYRLPQPPLCADSVFELIKACWSEDSADRPSFSIILQFLAQLKLEHRPTMLTQRSYRRLSVQPSRTSTLSSSSLVADEHGYVMAGSISGLQQPSRDADIEVLVDFQSLGGSKRGEAKDNYKPLTRPSMTMSKQDPVAIAMALRRAPQAREATSEMPVTDENPYELPQDAMGQGSSTLDKPASSSQELSSTIVEDYEQPQDPPPFSTAVLPAGPLAAAPNEGQLPDRTIRSAAPLPAIASPPAVDKHAFKPSAASSAAIDVDDAQYVNKATILAMRNDPSLLASEDDTISFDDFVKRTRAGTLKSTRMQPPPEAPPLRPSRGRKRLKSVTRPPRFTRQSSIQTEEFELDDLTQATADYHVMLSETRLGTNASEQTMA